LHERSGDGDRSFQGIRDRLVADLVADSGEQAMRRPGQILAGVEDVSADIASA
jgi:hypothetical protein